YAAAAKPGPPRLRWNPHIGTCPHRRMFLYVRPVRRCLDDARRRKRGGDEMRTLARRARLLDEAAGLRELQTGANDPGAGRLRPHGYALSRNENGGLS